MRLLTFFTTILLIVFIGCSKYDSPSAVELNQSEHALVKLPATKSASSLSSQFTVQGEIKGNKGGILPFEFELPSGVIVSGSLTFPKKAFKGEETFTIVFDNEYAVADFYPSPFQFDKALSLDFVYRGIDLGNLNINNLDFFYVSPDNKFESVEYSSKQVSSSEKILGIVNAKLNHFSRYGWGS